MTLRRTIGLLSSRIETVADWFALRKARRHRKHKPVYDDSIVAYHCSDNGVRELTAETQRDEVTDDLPSELMIPSGWYSICGWTYDCSLPGVYRFTMPQKWNEQRVVAASDGFRTALFLTLLFVRGNRDNGRSVDDRKRRAMRGLLVNTCGPAAVLVSDLLRESGFDCRVVSTHTTMELNSYNNGHTMLEVRDAGTGRYRLIDVDRKCYFVHESLGILDLFDFCRCINHREPFDIRSTNASSLVDWPGFIDVRSGFNYQFIEYLFHGSDQRSLALYRRIAAVPMIRKDGRDHVVLWGDSEEIRAEQEKWVVLSSSEFRRMFY